MAAYNEQQYTALCGAIAQGVLDTMYGDKRVTFRSLAEMKQIKADMEKELGKTKNSSRKRMMAYNKGLC